jgi:hypothetical protein
MSQHTITRTRPQKTAGGGKLGRLPHALSLRATDSCDELFRDIATRITRLAQNSLAATDECEQAERHAANAFHCVALLARLQDSVELKDQLLMQLKTFLAYQAELRPW